MLFSLLIRLFRQSLPALIIFIMLALVLSGSPARGAVAGNLDSPAKKADNNMPDNFKTRISDWAKSDSIKWLCYYGPDKAVLEIPGYNILVLEGDALGPIVNEKKGDSARVAYMSIGEISPDRWYWPEVKNKPWVLEKNRDWDGSARVDPRSGEWSDMLVNSIAPKLLAMGYDGLMLDNIDIGEYLEQKDPKKYAGAQTAVVDIIRRLGKAFPGAVLISNGGLDTAAEAADQLDAVIRESVFSRWIIGPDGSISYADVTPQARAWLRPRLLRIRGEGLPLLDLEYVAPNDEEKRERVLREAKAAGYFPYIAQRDLMRLPEPPEPSLQR